MAQRETEEEVAGNDPEQSDDFASEFAEQLARTLAHASMKASTEIIVGETNTACTKVFLFFYHLLRIYSGVIS